MLKLRAEIDRMDAVAAATTAAASEDKYVVIDGVSYFKTWLVGEESTQPCEGGPGSPA